MTATNKRHVHQMERATFANVTTDYSAMEPIAMIHAILPTVLTIQPVSILELTTTHADVIRTTTLVMARA